MKRIYIQELKDHKVKTETSIEKYKKVGVDILVQDIIKNPSLKIVFK